MRQEALDKVREIRHAYRHGFPTMRLMAGGISRDFSHTSYALHTSTTLSPPPSSVCERLATPRHGSVASFRLRRFVVWSPSNPCCKGGARRWRSASKGPISHQTLF